MKTRKRKPTRRPATVKISDPAVAKIFAAYPDDLRQPLLSLRQLILDTAADTPGVGQLEETLKWGEPAYLTSESKSGSTVRINRKPRSDSKYAIYFNCHTKLLDTFRTLYPDTFEFEGDRSIVFDVSDKLPRRELQTCIAIALTYHHNKK